MKINRIKKDKDFVVMHTHALRNKDLSLAAKGLHALIMQLPEDWELNVEGLVSLSKNGRDANASALKELELAGYVVKLKKREKGRFVGYEYNIYEVPQTNTNNGSTVNGKSVNGLTVNGSTVNGKTPTIKYEDINSSKEDIKELNAEFDNSPPKSQISLEVETVEPKNQLKQEKEKSAAKKEKEVPYLDLFKEAILYLNQKTGRNFQISPNDLKGKTDKYKQLAKIFAAGYGLEDIKAVVDAKVAEWLHDSKMCRYLEPSTLFSTKFERYLEAVKAGGVRAQNGDTVLQIDIGSTVSKARAIGITCAETDLSKIYSRIASKMPSGATFGAIEDKILVLLKLASEIGYTDAAIINKQYDAVVHQIKTKNHANKRNAQQP